MVNYIEYKEEKHPIRISYYALKQFQLETGKSIEALDEDMANIEILLWYGLIAGSKAEGKELTLEREDMEFLLDEKIHDVNKIIIESFPLESDSSDDKKK